MAAEKTMIPAPRGYALGVQVRDAEPFPTKPPVTGRPWVAERLPLG